MAPLFPAIFIGGPLQAGRSTLIAWLSHALAQRGVQHYGIGVDRDDEAPLDGAAPAARIATLHAPARGVWTSQFIYLVSHDVANRHLPLLFDGGDRPSPEMAQIAAQCTHAMLLAADLADVRPWRDLIAYQGLPLIAEICYDGESPDQIVEAFPIVRGTLADFRQGDAANGPCFAALVTRLARICTYDADELYRTHLAMIDLDLVLHVERPIHPLPAHTTQPWLPEELPHLLASLPPDEPLGVYGRGPAWLYAALAIFALTTRYVMFDVRQGWVDVPRLVLVAHPTSAPVQWTVSMHPEYTHVQVTIPSGYLDYREATKLPAPAVPTDRGVVLDGDLPHWFWAALARTYGTTAWVACCEPALQRAVVVSSQRETVSVGSTLYLKALE